MNESQKEIAQVCDDIKNMLLEKNLKYGDSALNPSRIFSKASAIEQILVRIDDKLNRIKQGSNAEDEDVINDLIGYFILLKIAKKNSVDSISFKFDHIPSFNSGSDTLSFGPDDYDGYGYTSFLDNSPLSSYSNDTLNFLG